MTEITARGVNEAMPSALYLLGQSYQTRPSRNGPVVAFPDPVMTTYTRPQERVLFSPMRDANPLFHLIEAMWMIGGRRDIAPLVPIVKQIAQYSDDGSTLYGAYGYRWRRGFGWDQLEAIANEIRKDPTTRRAVLSMWDPRGDHNKAFSGGKDVPCNTHIYFDCRDGNLNMTVCCRSNDLYWGCYGANVVHMSYLLEYMAAAVGVPMGVYRQFSNDLHVYTDLVPVTKFKELGMDIAKSNRYLSGVKPLPLFKEGERVHDLDEDIAVFFDEPRDYDIHSYETSLFNFTIRPMLSAWDMWKKKEPRSSVMEMADRIEAPDWRVAMREWLERRTTP